MSPLSNLPGPWRWEQRGEYWWRIHDELRIEDGPHRAPQTAEKGTLHHWRPTYFADGSPSFVCAICGQMSDADIHHAELYAMPQNDGSGTP